MAERLTRLGMFWQIAPPLLVCVWSAQIFWTDEPVWGPGFMFLFSGWFVLAGLFSLVRIGILLFRRVQPRGRLIRPVLTVLVVTLVVGCFFASFFRCKDDLQTAAEQFQVECLRHDLCQAEPSGWQKHGDTYRREVTALGVRWPLRYRPAGMDFTLSLVLGPDLESCLAGGVGRLLERCEE